MASLNGFNADEHEQSDDFVPIPAGDYIAVITDSERKPNSKGTGSYLAFTHEVVEGEYAGRKVFANLNIDNPSAKAVAIANGELSAICKAVGVPRPNDTVELHNLPMRIRVIVEKRTDNGGLTNRIKKWAPKNEAPDVKSVPTNGSSSAPWKK
jgi:hypothetical protein